MDATRPYPGVWLHERQIPSSRTARHPRFDFLHHFLDRFPAEIPVIESMAQVRPASDGPRLQFWFPCKSIRL